MKSGFVAIYRWRVHERRDAQFRQAWPQLTENIHTLRGSRGSRLHRDENGIYVAIALWPSRDLWEATTPELSDEGQWMGLLRESIAESFPFQLLTVVEDLWSAHEDEISELG